MIDKALTDSKNKQSLNRLSTVLLASLLCLVSVALNAQSTPSFPALSGRVVDQANLLDSAAEQALNAQLAEHEAQTLNQIVIVTVNSLQGLSEAQYALQLAREWRIGTQERNNGVVLLVAPNERKVRIEVGYGLEGVLTDGLARQIIERNIVPQFKEDDYQRGIESGTEAILQAVAGEYDAQPISENTGSSDDEGLLKFMPIFFIAMVVIPPLFRGGILFRIIHSGFPAAFIGLFVGFVSQNIFIGIGGGLAVMAMFLYVSDKPRDDSFPDIEDDENETRDGYTNHGYNQRLDNHHNRRNFDRHREKGGFGGSGGFSGGGGGFGGGGASGRW